MIRYFAMVAAFLAAVLLVMNVALRIYGDECLRTEQRIGYVVYWHIALPMRSTQCIEWKEGK